MKFDIIPADIILHLSPEEFGVVYRALEYYKNRTEAVPGSKILVLFAELNTNELIKYKQE